jgi:hypothetical protein
MSRARTLLLAAVAAVMLQTPAGLPVARAGSATESQNPELTVALSVPDRAAIGDTVAATLSISNNTPSFQSIVVKGVWTDPLGESIIQSESGLLLPGQTVTRVVDYVVDESCAVGLHEITLLVESQSGTSSATTAVEVV